MLDLRQIARLTPSEVPYRVRQLGTRLSDRWMRPPLVRAGPPPLWPVVPPPGSAPAVLRRLQEGFVLHGARIRPADRARWTHDPLTGRVLPAGHPDPLAVGFDPRPVWELHRLQHLALWSHLDPADPTPLAEANGWLRVWPTGVGLPWASALEAAFRLVSLTLLARAHHAHELRVAVHAHAWWLARHPSRGSSEGNHRVGELGALALAAHALPDLPDAAAWSAEAATLPEVFDRLLHADGGGAEQSTAYLATCLEWALLARACGVERLEDGIERASGFLATLLDEGGHAPRIGDDDGGRVLATTAGREPHYVCSVVGACAAALGRPAPPAWTPDLRSRLLGLTDAPGRHSAGAQVFRASGLTVLRQPGRLAVLDHGPLGGAHLAAHGHADALAVWLHLGGRAVLVGRGTPTYTGDPILRRAFRGTRAHSTLVVGGRDASDPSTHPFLWRRATAGVLDHACLQPPEVEAHHDGYLALRVRHRRRLSLRARAVVLLDQLEGTGRHHVAILLHLAPDLRVDEDGRVSAPEGPLMRIEAPAGLTLRVVRGGPDPIVGWHSPAYGERVPAPTVVLEGVVALPTQLRTLLHLQAGLWYDPAEQGGAHGRRSEPT